MKSKYPEHEKLRAVHDKTLVLSEFYDWLGQQGIQLGKYHRHVRECYEVTECKHARRCNRTGIHRRIVCGYNENFMYPIHTRPDELFGKFLGINPKKLSAEKEQMVEEMRAASAKA